MANNLLKKQQQIAITPETVVLPKPKPISSKRTTMREEDHLYASLRITQQTDDAYEPLRFDAKPQSHESEATAFCSESEQVVERGHIKLPTSEGREINERQGSPHAGGQAKEEQTSKNTKMWKVCSSKWRMITFVALITALSLCVLLAFAIATVGLSRANSAAESEQELQLMVQLLKDQADNMQKEFNKAMSMLDSALHQISTNTHNVSQLKNDMNTLSGSVVTNQNDIQTLKTNTVELFMANKNLSSTSDYLLTTVDMLSSTISASEMAMHALNSTFQDHLFSAETFFTDLVNSNIDGLEVQPFANCQPMEGLNAVTLHILNNSNATSTVLISTEPIQINRTGLYPIDIYCEAGGNVTALNQPLIATLRRTSTEHAFCECAMSHDLGENDVEQLQFEPNKELSFTLSCSLTVVNCPLSVPVYRN